MHAGYKGYKPIFMQVTRVTSQLQATQCIMHAGYKGYKPIASNTMYCACRLQGLQANCKQHNICIQVTRVTSQLQAMQCIMHAGYKGYKPIANNTICDPILENRLDRHIRYFEKYQFQILKPLLFSCARLIVTMLDIASYCITGTIL